MTPPILDFGAFATIAALIALICALADQYLTQSSRLAALAALVGRRRTYWGIAALSVLLPVVLGSVGSFVANAFLISPLSTLVIGQDVASSTLPLMLGGALLVGVFAWAAVSIASVRAAAAWRPGSEH